MFGCHDNLFILDVCVYVCVCVLAIVYVHVHVCVWIRAKDVPLCLGEAAKLVNGDGTLCSQKTVSKSDKTDFQKKQKTKKQKNKQTNKQTKEQNKREETSHYTL